MWVLDPCGTLGDHPPGNRVALHRDFWGSTCSRLLFGAADGVRGLQALCGALQGRAGDTPGDWLEDGPYGPGDRALGMGEEGQTQPFCAHSPPGNPGDADIP